MLHQFLAGRTFISTLIIAPHAVKRVNMDFPQSLRLEGFRTGLHHLVITWDGQQTTAYDNGVKFGPVVNCSGSVPQLWGDDTAPPAPSH